MFPLYTVATETIDKIAATFESYWNSNEFEYYEEGQRERLIRALKAEKYSEINNIDIYTLDILPYSYQQEILDKLEAERTVRGYNRNLVVAATGTGKTVISALDYKRFCRQHPGQPCRLLFVAHREEILKQSMYTFRAVLKDANFGNLFVGSHKADSIDHLFISIQTFNSQDFTTKTDADFYDYIVVDEFHHAAAPTYQKLLVYYQPQILLGLTATPERMDGKNILDYFGGRIAAEIRLPEAIDRKLLCPFQYFGVTDTVDLSSLKWRTGGYDKNELSNLYTFSGLVAERRADLVVNSILKYVTDINEVKGLGLGYWSRSQRFLKKKNNSILRIYRPNVHTVVSHWFCAMENTVSFGDAVPIQNAVLHARLNSLSICCTRGFSFYNLYPLVVPSHTPIGLFNNQQRIKERNIHLPEDTFQTGSAGG